jgi:2,4-dichlorophenol 6-monooxygenase
MNEIYTDVLIVGTGPAGSSAAALLSTYGIENILVNNHRWLANTPRAHITNQRTMEVLRDLGKEIEKEAYLYATEQNLMGENIFCTSLAGEELGRVKSWGTHPNSKAEHLLSSPSFMNDLPQNFMEPLLFKTACSRGSHSKMSTQYLSHLEDDTGITTTCLDLLNKQEFTIRSKYLIGADGSNSTVASDIGLPFEGKMGVGGSMNIHFKADLSQYVAHRPSVLYWVLQPGADVGGIGMGLIRMIRPWNEWLIVWGYNIEEPEPSVDHDFAVKVTRDLVGVPDLEIDLLSVSTWTVNNMYATKMSRGRVFCAGDATHRHPPSNGLGSNTSIQDSFNLSWKLAYVLKGIAGSGLLETYSAERAPIAKEVVTRANQSIVEFSPIFEALGLTSTKDLQQMTQNMKSRIQNTPEGELQRKRLRDAISFKKYEFDAHGVEMNQRYKSQAVYLSTLEKEPLFNEDKELHYQPTTFAGARIPHAWVYGKHGNKYSTLDLCGKGKFTIFTGIGGDGWISAADKVSAATGVEIECRVIGPNQEFEDHAGDWAYVREIEDSGVVLVRPDHHVCWRVYKFSLDASSQLRSVMASILNTN